MNADALRDRGQSIALALACAVGGVPLPSQAASWVLTPEFSTGAEYSSNPQLRADVPRAGEAATVHVGAPLDWTDAAEHAQLAPRLRLGAASGDSSLGADAFYLTGAGDFYAELGKLSAQVALADDSSVIRQPEAGTLTRSNVREHDVDAKLDWTRSLTERVSLDVGLSNRRVGYGFRPDVGLFDYRYRELSGQLTRRVGERLSVVLIMTRSHYELPERVYHEDSSAQQAGLAGSITELWSFQALYGRSRLASIDSVDHPVGSVYSATVNRKGPRSALAASMTRSLQPSGFGVLAQTRESKASWSWALTERRTLSASWRSVETRNAFGTLTFADRRFDSVAIDLTWRLTELWDAALEANHARAGSPALLNSAASYGTGNGASATFSRRFGPVHLK